MLASFLEKTALLDIMNLFVHSLAQNQYFIFVLGIFLSSPLLVTLNTLGPLAKREAKRTMGTQWREREVDLSAFRALGPGNGLRKGLRVFP